MAGVASLSQGSLGRFVIVAVVAAAAVVGIWYLIASRGTVRMVGAVIAVAALVGLLVSVLTAHDNGWRWSCRCCWW